MTSTGPFPPDVPDPLDPPGPAAGRPADPNAGDDDPDDTGVVVDLGKRRRAPSGADRPSDPGGQAADRDDDDDDDVDRESVGWTPEVAGPPVDPPDDGVRPSGATRRRVPVVPAWLASPTAVRAAVRQALRDAGYVAAFHASRAPKYAGKVAVWAPVGFVRTVVRLLRWATAEDGNWALRQDAARRNDPETWLKLDRQRQRQTTTRWPILIVSTLAALVGYAVVWFGPWPWPARWGLFAATAVLLARLGRPADRPITDRVTTGPAYRKLTADLVRRGLTSLGLQGINSAVAKDPGAISFPVEIHRDGPGHLAIVDLPYGVEAGDVIARRGRLASGLRLPLDQVWPEPAPGHTGRLALWVGHEPASRMRQPAWPLLREGQVDVFKPFAFATDPRMTVVTAELMFRNWLFGGQPGSGKTFALRLLALAASLDTRVELRIYELKGVGDFRVLEEVCAEYGNGQDDDTYQACAAMLDWLYEECQRRSKKIDQYARVGKAPENKVTPELAGLTGSGLHPLVVVIDEIQELFLSRWGKQAGETAEKVIKLGRALGIVLLVGTQIPDKDSLPPGITRNVNTRFCLSVADQVANDMILGTSAYKNGYRATVFQPVVEAGWGILAGLGKPGARHAYEVNTDQAGKVVARAVGLRSDAGTLPAPEARTRQAASFDPLADLAAVWPAGEDKAWNDTLCTRLAELRPDAYAGWEPAQLTAALKPHGIPTRQVWGTDPTTGKGANRKGIHRADLTTAITVRDRKRNGS